MQFRGGSMSAFTGIFWTLKAFVSPRHQQDTQALIWRVTHHAKDTDCVHLDKKNPKTSILLQNNHTNQFLYIKPSRYSSAFSWLYVRDIGNHDGHSLGGSKWKIMRWNRDKHPNIRAACDKNFKSSQQTSSKWKKGSRGEEFEFK